MSAHNRVIWSEGLFLQPQHFQQQDRYFERYVETRCQALVPHSWGFTEIELERDFLSIGKFGLRRARRRVSRRHAVPDARRRSAAAADRHRRRRARSDRCISRCRCAAPASSKSTARPDADELVRHDVRELQARDAAVERGDPATARSGGAAHAAAAARARSTRGLCLRAARAHRRVPRRQAGRARRQLHSDGAACARGAAAGDVHDRAARAAAPARRSAWRARVGDRPGRRGGDRRLPDAAGDQPLRAAAGALTPSPARLHPEELFQILRRRGRRAGDVHDDVEAAAEVSRPIGTSGCASRSSR